MLSDCARSLMVGPVRLTDGCLKSNVTRASKGLRGAAMQVMIIMRVIWIVWDVYIAGLVTGHDWSLTSVLQSL